MTRTLPQAIEAAMKLKTKIGDVLETVRIQSSGQWEGQRLAVTLTNQACCDFADKLIAQGNWRIRDTTEEERDLPT